MKTPHYGCKPGVENTCIGRKNIYNGLRRNKKVDFGNDKEEHTDAATVEHIVFHAQYSDCCV